MTQAYNVLIVAQYKDLGEDLEKELFERLEEHGMEKIPTVNSAWEIKFEAEDETDAKDKAIQTFINVSRTYPCEMGLVVQCGGSQILRRRKKFEP